MLPRWRIILRRSRRGLTNRTRPTVTRWVGSGSRVELNKQNFVCVLPKPISTEETVEFSFTEEQQHLRRSVREFAEGEIAPHVMEWDEASHFPVEIMPKLAEMGLLGVIFPEQYGGAGLGYIEYALAIEELSRVDGSVGLIVVAHNSLCSYHIFKFGMAGAKKKYLVPLASGKAIGAWSLTEPEAGSGGGGRRAAAGPAGSH